MTSAIHPVFMADDEWAWRFRALMHRPSDAITDEELRAFYGAVAQALDMTDDPHATDPPPIGPTDGHNHSVALTAHFCKGMPGFLVLVYAVVRHTRPTRTWAQHAAFMTAFLSPRE
jgi:hypothetical protein